MRRTAQTWQLEHEEQDRRAIDKGIADAARDAGVELAAGAPYAGWVTDRHSRDGKFWPCRQETTGAQPAWIWKGTEK
jgi:hypothetical protein